MTQQTDSEAAVLLIAELGQQRLVVIALLAEELDGLEHKRIHDSLVIVPVDVHLLQDVIQLLVVADELPVGLAPECAVLCIAVLRSLHVGGIEGAVLYLGVERAHKVLLVSPGYLLRVHIVTQLTVPLKLKKEAVIDEAAVVQLLQAQSARSAAAHLLHTEPHAPHFHNQ